MEIPLLASEVMSRLVAILPGWASLRLDEPFIVVSIHGRETERVWLPLASTEEDVAQVVHIATKAMSGVQDVMSLETHEPWPVASDGRRRVTAARAEVRQNVLFMWYDDEEGVVLELAPLSFDR